MEQLLRGKEISKINIVDLNKSIQYVPIRHHSPICAWHLKNIIELWKPDCILIEGPENAQEQIPILTHTDTKAPIALYYYYTDKKGLISEKKDEYRCYYPFLDCSPEFVALKEAQNRQIPVFFIDLPYSEILLATKTAKGLRAKTEKQTYNNDYLFSQNQYMKLLCENAGLRDFEEFWEKYFEIKGLYQSTEDFINQMYLYCTLAREHTPIEELEADGCLAREQYMAEQIAEKANIYHKILVVTGGFHTKGIMELLEQKQDKNVEISTDISVSVTEDTFSKRNHCVSKQHIECKKKPQNTDGMEGVYPIAYSMKATDVLNGYASGMQSPAFYQLVWEKLSNISVNDLYTVYEDAVLHQLIKIGRKSRQKKENISSYDIICAFSMAKGLAMLRGKPQAGLYELRDSVLSSFVKGECNLSTDMPLRILEECNTGTQVGSLCKQAPRPPLLLDFEEQCQKFGLQIQEIIYKEVVLQVFTKKKHLEMSRFFYQMEFLETNFARRKKGADLVTGKDRNRIREVWNYEFSTQVLAVLVDVSVFGGTIKEASYTKLLKAFAESKTAKEAAKLITEGFLMGFWEIQLRMAIDMEKILTEDGDFFSLTEAFSYLKMLYELRELYQVEDDAPLEIMIQSCFQKIIQLLPSMANIPKEEQERCMKACLALYQITGKENFVQLRPLLMDAFLRLADKNNIQPGLEGTVLGLLYGYDSQYEMRIQRTAEGYLQGTKEQQMKSASFLRGLFYTAKDLVFVQASFLQMADTLVGKLSADAFLQILPEMRRAFSYFTPFETDRIAHKIAEFHGAKANQIKKGRMVMPLEYEYGELLDKYIINKIQNQDNV